MCVYVCMYTASERWRECGRQKKRVVHQCTATRVLHQQREYYIKESTTSMYGKKKRVLPQCTATTLSWLNITITPKRASKRDREYCTYIYIHIAYVCVYICIYIYVYVCIHTHIFVYKHIRSSVYTVHVCIFSIYVCVYMFIYITYMYNHTYIQICVHAKLTRQPNLRTSPARVSAEYLINLNKYMLKPSPSNQIEGRGMYVYIFVYKHIRSCVYTVPVCIFSIYVCVYMFIYIQIEGRGMYACKCVYTHCIYARTYKYERTHKTQCVVVCCSVLLCVAVCCTYIQIWAHTQNAPASQTW